MNADLFFIWMTTITSLILQVLCKINTGFLILNSSWISNLLFGLQKNMETVNTLTLFCRWSVRPLLQNIFALLTKSNQDQIKIYQSKRCKNGHLTFKNGLKSALYLYAALILPKEGQGCCVEIIWVGFFCLITILATF